MNKMLGWETANPNLQPCFIISILQGEEKEIASLRSR